MIPFWHSLRRRSTAHRNSQALRQLSAALQQWTETLSARVESVDITAAQHRATQSQLIANLQSSLDNLATAPVPAVGPISIPAAATLVTTAPSPQPVPLSATSDDEMTYAEIEDHRALIEGLMTRVDQIEAEVKRQGATVESWHTTTWTRIENLTTRVDQMETHQAMTNEAAQQHIAELATEVRALDGQQTE